MDENSYEYECMRAELLGVAKPTLEEYQSRRDERNVVEDEQLDIENLKAAEDQNENFRNVSGGLHELGNILSATQKKLNRFKASCGSLTNLLKIKMGSASGSNESIVLNATSKDAQDSVGLDNSSLVDSPKKLSEHCPDHMKNDLSNALDNHVDKLDLLIEKAEHCQYSMSEQNNQMKKFLR
ncbi:hypothetical protein RN001_011166 [Aquatica leii]|uniref:Uncharacterized protein n=1 Tax=Aquatica leii TaxID=1421715 RepID=A0AAN7Q3V9_9COLE|nr:hypothetical protein RN001_011166 [Aquatica leii]